MIAPDVLTDWLLESLEAMTDNERSNRPTSLRALQAKALADFIEREWRPRTDLELAMQAPCSPATLSGFKNRGAAKLNKPFERVAKALGLDSRALFQGKIVRVENAKSIHDSDDIVSLASDLRGHPDEQRIKAEIRKALSASADRKPRRK